MVSNTVSVPDFLKRAKKVEQPQNLEQSTIEQPIPKEKPSFLSRAKKVSDKGTVLPFEGENDLEREMERSQARATSRSLETIIGAPGDILSFGAWLIGKELPEAIPTSQKLKKFSEETTRGYTAPKNEFEEKSDEVMRDIASFAMPGSQTYSMFRNIGIPIIANLGKEGIKYAGGDEKGSSMAKAGMMVALDLITQRKGAGGGAKEFSSNLFKQAEKSIEKGVSVQATGLEKSLNTLEKTLSSGGSRPTTKKSLEKIDELRKEIKNGKIDVKRLAAYRPSINEAIEEMGGFNIEVPKKLKPAAIRNLNQVKSEVIKTLDQYGEKFNPEFLKFHKAANESWAAYQNSNKIANFIDKHAGKWAKSPATKMLFGSGLTYGAAALGKTAALTGGALALGYPSFKVLHRVMNSPTLRTYYGNILKGSLSGNTSQVSRNMKLLDKELSKEPIQKGSVEE